MYLKYFIWFIIIISPIVISKLIGYYRKHINESEKLIFKKNEYVLRRNYFILNQNIYFDLYNIEQINILFLGIKFNLEDNSSIINKISIILNLSDINIKIYNRDNVLKILKGLKKYDSSKYNSFLENNFGSFIFEEMKEIFDKNMEDLI